MRPVRPTTTTGAPPVRRAAASPPSPSLARTIGNRATGRLLARADWRDVVDPLGVTSAIGGIVGFFGSGLVEQGTFKRAAYASRQRPIWRAEWDAWGHALTAAASASFGGEGHTWLFGSAAEGLHELAARIGVSEHDSYGEDTHNQAVGRSLAEPGASVPEMVRACNQAYLQGRLRIGPARDDAWMPWAGDRDFHAVHRHEGRMWLPRDGSYVSDPAAWIEAVDPGRDGRARGSGRHPSTPMPAG